MCNNIIGGLPIYVEEAEGNNAVPSRDYLVPHVEEGGALAPGRGILASLQGSPQDLMYGDQGTIHVPLLRRCETMETQGGGREENQHHEMRSTHPYPLQKVDAPKKVIVLRSGSIDRVVHTYMQSPLDEDVSLHGDILPGRPLDQQRRMDASLFEAPLTDSRGVGTLGELDTVLGVLGRLK